MFVLGLRAAGGSHRAGTLRNSPRGVWLKRARSLAAMWCAANLHHLPEGMPFLGAGIGLTHAIALCAPAGNIFHVGRAPPSRSPRARSLESLRRFRFPRFINAATAGANSALVVSSLFPLLPDPSAWPMLGGFPCPRATDARTLSGFRIAAARFCWPSPSRPTVGRHCAASPAAIAMVSFCWEFQLAWHITISGFTAGLCTSAVPGWVPWPLPV